MVFRALGACAALVFTASTAAVAQEAKPLRTLSFNVDYSAVSSMRSSLTGGREVGRGFEDTGYNNDDKGQVNVDVIAATQDGGLVVDAGFTGEKSKQPKVRIAILSDGSLAFDAKQSVAPEVLELLPLLGRGLLSGHEFGAGESWSIPAAAPANGTRTFRVSGRSDDTATLSIVTDSHTGTGPQGYDRHEESTLVYEPKVNAPMRYETRIHLRRLGLNGPETTDLHLVASLTSDSFAKKP